MQKTDEQCWYVYDCYLRGYVLLVLLRCDIFQGQLVSVGVSVEKSVVGLGFGVYTRAPSATVVSTTYTLALWVGA